MNVSRSSLPHSAAAVRSSAPSRVGSDEAQGPRKKRAGRGFARWSMLVRSARCSRLFVKFERIRLQDGTRTDYKCLTSRSHVPTIRNGWRADAIGQCRHRVNTVVIRISVIIVIISVLCGSARADEPEAEKMSNDRPDRPFQMPPASSETKEAFDDFERFARRGAWERATKALYTIPEAQAARFVDGQNGFIVSVAHKRRAVLAGLSPEGQAAYRLFYDADAKKLLDQAEGAGEQSRAREALFVLLPDLGRRQRGGSPGRPVLRTGAVRPRRRLLAGHPPGAF